MKRFHVHTHVGDLRATIDTEEELAQMKARAESVSLTLRDAGATACCAGGASPDRPVASPITSAPSASF